MNIQRTIHANVKAADAKSVINIELMTQMPKMPKLRMQLRLLNQAANQAQPYTTAAPTTCSKRTRSIRITNVVLTWPMIIPHCRLCYLREESLGIGVHRGAENASTGFLTRVFYGAGGPEAGIAAWWYGWGSSPPLERIP